MFGGFSETIRAPFNPVSKCRHSFKCPRLLPQPRFSVTCRRSAKSSRKIPVLPFYIAGIVQPVYPPPSSSRSPVSSSFFFLFAPTVTKHIDSQASVNEQSRDRVQSVAKVSRVFISPENVTICAYIPSLSPGIRVANHSAPADLHSRPSSPHLSTGMHTPAARVAILSIRLRAPAVSRVANLSFGMRAPDVRVVVPFVLSAGSVFRQ